MGKITKTPFVMCYILRISVLWSCWPNKPKPVPNQQYKSSLVALTLGPRGVQLWWIPDSHPAQRSKSSQSSGALRRARNKVKGFISLSSKDRWSSRDMIWPVRKNYQFDKSFYGQCMCIFRYFDQHCLLFKGPQCERWRVEERMLLEKYFPYKCYRPKGFILWFNNRSWPNEWYSLFCFVFHACLQLWILVWSDLFLSIKSQTVLPVEGMFPFPLQKSYWYAIQLHMLLSNWIVTILNILFSRIMLQ